jgi:hypothetical protein
VSIEIDENGAWMFKGRSCGHLPNAALHEVLRWALQQLHFGCWRLESDKAGEAVTLVLGKNAAIPFAEPIIDTAIEHERRRDWALDFAGIFAAAREEGIEPDYLEGAEIARFSATENAYMNTEFYYAFAFVDLLRRIREKTFIFANLPIKGPLPETVSKLLGEATRAYLFKLNRSSVSLCRALLEATLRDRVDMTELLQERFETKKGELECLINLGVRTLGADGLEKAHRIRKAGNDAMHGKEPSDNEAWAVLLDVREILEQLLATSKAA